MLKRTLKYLAMSLIGLMLAATATCNPIQTIQNEIAAGRLVQDVALIGTLAGLGT